MHWHKIFINRDNLYLSLGQSFLTEGFHVSGMNSCNKIIGICPIQYEVFFRNYHYGDCCRLPTFGFILLLVVALYFLLACAS